MRRVTRTCAALFLALCADSVARADAASPAADEFVAAGPARGFDGPLGAAVGSISTARLAAHVAFLASPALAGRGLGTRDLEVAAEYVAASLALAGVAPAGQGGPGSSAYFQAVQLRSFGPRGGSLAIEAGGGPGEASAFAAGRDWMPPEIPARTLRLPVVFAGHGMRDARLGHNDYRGLDVRGKAVLVLDGLPDGAAWRTPDALARHAAADGTGGWDEKLDVARGLGAAVVLAALRQGAPLAPPEGETDAPGFFLPAEPTTESEETLLVPVSSAVAAALLGGTAAGSVPAAPRELPASVTIEVTGEERRIAGANVLGVIPGSDPARAGEAVVIGAHLDHLGVVDGAIHPGADDNASGVAALLEIARAFAAAPPRRKVLVAFWTGEEEGKLGSGHYVRNPSVPLAGTVAYLNLDMIGHAWSAQEIRDLAERRGLPDADGFLRGLDPADFVEPGVPPGSPVLEAALRRAAAGAGLALRFDRTDGRDGGSDYRDFARAGVPFVRFFGTFFDGYHEPGDTPDTLDAAQVRTVARLAFATAWLLANELERLESEGTGVRGAN
jgi:hypothetical protein